ncbi:hypothetical protein GALL_445450 [mine drainage metagenome]|uniref:Uncharacterized protein n=1 Tax=mine drainage metagenome TaxID=410659 RepID=A0A1J5QCW1_9ZZZZ
MPQPALAEPAKLAEPKLVSEKPAAQVAAAQNRPDPTRTKVHQPHKPTKAPKPLHKPVSKSPKSVPKPSLKPASKPATKSAAVTPAASSPQVLAHDTLEQAQELWRSGSHQAAIDLLYQAAAKVERALAVGGQAGDKAVLALLVRDLSSMELAEGQVKQTMDMLVRLEPFLSGFADIWAIRGNVAQRLGHHAESVAAYQMALKLRPNEPRWMLGQAVSLAAQGQTGPAAQLAEQARQGGALTPEVANYLRQLGVELPPR